MGGPRSSAPIHREWLPTWLPLPGSGWLLAAGNVTPPNRPCARLQRRCRCEDATPERDGTSSRPAGSIEDSSDGLATASTVSRWRRLPKIVRRRRGNGPYAGEDLPARCSRSDAPATLGTGHRECGPQSIRAASRHRSGSRHDPCLVRQGPACSTVVIDRGGIEFIEACQRKNSRYDYPDDAPIVLHIGVGSWDRLPS
jgi:hypothetical protein